MSMSDRDWNRTEPSRKGKFTLKKLALSVAIVLGILFLIGTYTNAGADNSYDGQAHSALADAGYVRINCHDVLFPFSGNTGQVCTGANGYGQRHRFEFEDANGTIWSYSFHNGRLAPAAR